MQEGLTHRFVGGELEVVLSVGMLLNRVRDFEQKGIAFDSGNIEVRARGERGLERLDLLCGRRNKINLSVERFVQTGIHRQPPKAQSLDYHRRRDQRSREQKTQCQADTTMPWMHGPLSPVFILYHVKIGFSYLEL